MKIIHYIIILCFLITSCEKQHKSSNIKKYQSEKNLNELIDAYIFLSENHDLLHIMMGEYKGSPIEAYNDYTLKINALNYNFYMDPIKHGLKSIIIKNNTLNNADKFDALVDYYQMGIQLIIEGILKGAGYIEKMPSNSEEYLKIKSIKL